MPDNGGVRLRDTLRSVERQTGRKDDRLHKPTIHPEVSNKVWNTFFEVNTARQSNGFGPEAISYLELQAWCSLMDEKLSPWEVTMFRMMDSVFLDVVHSKQKEG